MWLKISARDYLIIREYYRTKSEIMPAISSTNSRLYINDTFSERARKDLAELGIFAYGSFFYNPYYKDRP
jgi:hypothetical protein